MDSQLLQLKLKRLMKKRSVRLSLVGIVVVLILAVVLLLVLPSGKKEKVTLPNFAEMVAENLFYPHLFLASDSQAILAPPMLDVTTIAWAGKIPPKEQLEENQARVVEIYRSMFQERYSNAVELAMLAMNELTGEQKMQVRVALAQTYLLKGDYDGAVRHYETACKENPSDARLRYQLAFTYAYSGRYREAKRIFNLLEEAAQAAKEAAQAESGEGASEGDSAQNASAAAEGGDSEAGANPLDAPVDSITIDETLVQHWNCVLQVLMGEKIGKVKDTFVALREKYQKEYYTKMGLSPDSTGTVPVPAEGETVSTEVYIAGRNFAMLSNNTAAVWVLTRDDNLAAAEVDLLKTIGETFARGTARTAPTLALCAWNMQGIAISNLGKYAYMEEGDLEPEEEPKTPEEEEIRKMEQWLRAYPAPDTCFDNAMEQCRVLKLDEDTPYPVLIQSNRLMALSQQKFSSRSCRDLTTFRKTDTAFITQLREQNSEWEKMLQDGHDMTTLPISYIAVENALAAYYTTIEGSDKIADRNSLLAASMCKKRLAKNSLAEMTVQEQTLESSVLERFAHDGKLGKLTNTRKQLKKQLDLAKKTLPPNHPLMSEYWMLETRTAFLDNDLKAAQSALGRAQKILLHEKSFTPRHPLVLKARVLGAMFKSLKSTDNAEIAGFQKEILQKLTEAYGEKSLPVAMAYRDFGFVFAAKNQPKEALACYRNALTTYQAIYGLHSDHMYIRTANQLVEAYKEK